MATSPFFGKFRGSVVGVIDPLQMGRVQVVVPDVTGLEPVWALPCFPALGNQMSMYAVPPFGSNVWVEFEQGNVDLPIWTGCFPGSAVDMPASATEGAVILRAAGSQILINDTGITISNGKGAIITLAGPNVEITQ